MGMVKRFEIYLVNLDPTIGVEIQKRRPCLIISPDEMNRNVKTAIIAPMTTKARGFPTRIACQFEGKNGFIVLDQIRTVDKVRLIKKLGEIDNETRLEVLEKLQEVFAS
ncbi:MAG: type II toxin-antitoxin system PemK/MazF family toxin [Acidobacteriota bacterium]|jgi:mRNA interferase MazF|nr:type II toxin-antitoxin system PemK/MazF family toxin [Acidobacteriota bacterium]MDQ3375106.1 type II toxin-antitoxin system PemK/MazF family toxin [Acidobacteriota bacterium]